MSVTAGLVLAGNLVGSAFASHQGAKANRKIRDSIQGDIDLFQGMYDQEKHGTPFTRPDTQAALSRTREGLQDAMKTNRGNAIRTGATAEKEVAGQEGAARGYADTMTGILTADGHRRDMAKNRYMQMMSGLKGQKLQTDMQDAQKWPQMMQNLGGLSDTAIEVFN